MLTRDPPKATMAMNLVAEKYDATEQTVLEVLTLDDVITDRRRLQRLCRRAGLQANFHDAATLEEFAAALERTRFDIAFLDYHLGIGNGLDALRALSDHPKQTEAIAILVSSMGGLDLAIRAMREGCADYINKEELSVENVRKSVALAFERRLLLSSLREAQQAEQDMRLLLRRISLTCGREVCGVIGAALEQAARYRDAVKTRDGDDFAGELEQLKEVCTKLSRYLAELQVGADVTLTPEGLGPRKLDG
ncbi:MAG: response regulator [Pseudomonadota bacterium]